MSQTAVYVYLTSTHPNKLLNILQFSQVDVTVQKRKDFPTAEIMLVCCVRAIPLKNGAL